MPVRRHGPGWEARVQSAGRRLGKTFTSRRDAQEWEARFRARIADSRVGRAPRYALSEAVNRWLTADAKSLKSYDSLLEKVRVIYPHIQGRALHEVGEVAAAIKAAGMKDGLKPATINRRLAILRRVARLAFRVWGWLDQDVSGRVTLLPGEEQRHVYLKPLEARRLLAAARGKVRDAIRWALLTGLRRGELLAVTPESFQDGALVINVTKSGRPRIVPLPGELDAKRFPHGLTKDELRNGFEAARKKAGLAHVRFHDLRHTYASWLIQGGAMPTAVRDLLGHSSLAVTSRYSHLGRRDLWQAVQGLGIGRNRARRAVAARKK